MACGSLCRPGLRWCSLGCFYAEDGYPEENDGETHAGSSRDDTDEEEQE